MITETRLVPTWPFAFTGFSYLDKMVPEFHGISTVILKFLKQLICQAVIVPAPHISRLSLCRRFPCFPSICWLSRYLVLIHSSSRCWIPFTNSSINLQSAVTASQDEYSGRSHGILRRSPQRSSKAEDAMLQNVFSASVNTIGSRRSS